MPSTAHPARAALRRLSYLILPALFLLVYVGDSFRKPAYTAPLFFALLGLFVAACLWREAPAEPQPDAGGVHPGWLRASGLLGAGLLWVLVSDRTYQGMVLYANRPLAFWAAVALATVTLLALVVHPPSRLRGRPWTALGLVAASGLALRAFGPLQWELNPARRDMMPLIYSALETFTAGHNPYGFHQMQVGSQVPLTYPPGLWLAHLPPYLVGLDIRWTAWAADAVILLAIGGAAIRWAPRAFGPVLLALTAYLFLPDTHWNAIYAEPHFDWAVVAVLCAATISGRPMATGAAYGVALLTRPFNVLLAPFLAIWLWRRFGARTALRSLLVSGLIAAVVYVPFVAADPAAFYVGTVRWLTEYGPVHSRWFHGMLGFSGLLYKHQLAHLMLPIQLGGLATLTLLAAWKLRTTRHLLVFWLVTYAHFVAFNSLVWMSFWIGVLLLATAALVAAEAPERAPPSTPTSASPRPLAIELPAALIVAAAFVFLMFHLHGYFTMRGQDAVQAFLRAQATPGDLILDRSDYRAAFLDKHHIFDRATLPPGTGLAETPFAQVLPRRAIVGPLAAERVWVVERHGLFAPVRGVYFAGDEHRGPYRVEREEHLGRFRVLELTRAATPVGRPFSADARALHVAARIEAPDGRGESLVDGKWRDGKWQFERAASWQHVGPRSCRFERVSTPMLWAHPWMNRTALEISAPRPDGASYITVFGGLVDGAPEWGRAPVHVTVRSGDAAAGDTVLGTATFENRPGVQGQTFALPRGAADGRVTLVVTSPDEGRRHFCVDAVFSGEIAPVAP